MCFLGRQYNGYLRVMHFFKKNVVFFSFESYLLRTKSYHTINRVMKLFMLFVDCPDEND